MGKGYAAEAGKTLLRLAREDLGVRDVIVCPGVKNQRSIQVAQKLSFVKGGEIETIDGKPNIVYILSGMKFDNNMSLSIWGESKA